MPETKPLPENQAALQFWGMADFFEKMAENCYQQWETMRFVKKKNGGPGWNSKEDFNEEKRFVWQTMKTNLHRMELCKAVHKELTTGVKQDLDKVQPQSSYKRVGKIIIDNFKLILPDGGRK